MEDGGKAGAEGPGAAGRRGRSPGAAPARGRSAPTARPPGRAASSAGASLTFPGGRGGETGWDRVVGGRMPR